MPFLRKVAETQSLAKNLFAFLSGFAALRQDCKVRFHIEQLDTYSIDGALFGGALNGFDDLVITGAAAEVAGQVEADFLFAGCRVFFEQRFGLHDETRSADAAL